MDSLLYEARSIFEKMVKHRRYLHENAECGFMLSKTLEYIDNELKRNGYTPKRIGKGSLYAEIGHGEDGILLRADIDALEVEELSNLPYACKNGKAHVCGHDMHASMLLGAAELLSIQKSRLKSRVTLLFQGGEEILEGAKDTIDNNILNISGAKSAISIHVIPAMNLEAGTVMLPCKGIVAPAADYFRITLKGVSCHGSTPWVGRDALTTACKIINEIKEGIAVKIPPYNAPVISVGKLNAGTAGNIIADSAVFEGTVRCNSDETQAKLKEMIKKTTMIISENEEIKANVDFMGSTPTLKIDEELSKKAEATFKYNLGDKSVIRAQNQNEELGGSEDFAHFSHRIPSLLIGIAAGSPDEGYIHPLHHPEVRFDENILPIGAVCYCSLALK